MYVCMVVCVERIQRSKTRTVKGEGIQHFLPMIYYILYISYMCAHIIGRDRFEKRHRKR
jgi:hypothetical protein